MIICAKFFGFGAASDKEVSCEKIVNYLWSHQIGTQKTCNMEAITKIDSLGFQISDLKDDTVLQVRMYGNLNIRFLPENTAEKFPNLIAYVAPFCSIESISRKNFMNLRNLKELILNSNQIERIDGETFRDLMSLEILFLRKNFDIIFALSLHVCFQNLTKLNT
jgi:Leucine-rich repeat (LRR) protein